MNSDKEHPRPSGGDRVLTIAAFLAIPVLLIALGKGVMSGVDTVKRWSNTRHERQLIDSLIQNQGGHGILGNVNGKKLILEFSDYQCPFCKIADSTIEAGLAHNKDVKIIVFQFPLTGVHPYALGAAKAAVCSLRLGRFEQYHHALYRGTLPASVDSLWALSKLAGVTDSTAFRECWKSEETSSVVSADMQLGKRLSVPGEVAPQF